MADGRDGIAATRQERVVDEARYILRSLDEARVWNAERGNSLKQIDFAIGATLGLRKAVREYDEAVGRG